MRYRSGRMCKLTSKSNLHAVSTNLSSVVQPGQSWEWISDGLAVETDRSVDLRRDVIWIDRDVFKI